MAPGGTIRSKIEKKLTEARRMLTRPGRLRAWSGYILPKSSPRFLGKSARGPVQVPSMVVPGPWVLPKPIFWGALLS